MVTRAQIEISVIGNVEARIDGRPVQIPRGRARVLLAALALEAGRPRAVSRLMDYLWGGTLPENPRTSLQNLVRQLRQLIGADAIRTFAEGYQLDLPAEHVDVYRFVLLGDELASCPADDRQRRHALIEAMEQLWQDEPLADVGSSTLVREYAPGLFERYLSMVEARADLDIAAGHQARAIGDLRELTTRLPLHESLWARLLGVLRDTGRVAEALDTYEQLRTTLADELGADPSPALQELHHQLLTVGADPQANQAEPPLQQAVTDEPELVDPEPELPRQLPAAPAGFVGRTTETTALDRLLDDCWSVPAKRGNPPLCLAVLHGPGGIGKTSLAITWAHQVSPDFPDGQLYVDLQGFGPGTPLEPHLVLGMLLRSLGVPNENIPAGTVERSGLFRTRVAGRRILVVLDNAHDEEQVRPLLPGSGAMVLVTSRNRLRDLSIREGAVGVTVREFPDDDARTLIAGVLGTDRLAVEDHTIDDMIDLCGGLPLALRIAAEMCSRYPDTPLSDIMAELGVSSEQAGPLVDGLRALFTWSYQAVSSRAARLLRQLGWFPGRTIGVEAASALLDEEQRESVAVLDELVKVHLVEEPTRGRFWLHDLTRVYARERFDLEEDAEAREATVRRMSGWWLHTVREANEVLGYSTPYSLTGEIDAPVRPTPGFTDHPAALRWFESERANVVAMAEAAAAHGLDHHTWQFCRASRDFLSAGSYYDDLLRIGEVASRAAERTRDPVAIGYSASTLGAVYGFFERYEDGQRTLLHGLWYAREFGDLERVSSIASMLAYNWMRAGDHEAGFAYDEEAIDAARKSGNQRALANVLLNSGSHQIELGDVDLGIQQSTEALAWYSENDSPRPRALALGNLGDAYLRKGMVESAEEHTERALEILTELGDRRYAGSVLADLGRIRAHAGRIEQAVDTWWRALSLLSPHDRKAREVRSRLEEAGRTGT